MPKFTRRIKKGNKKNKTYKKGGAMVDARGSVSSFSKPRGGKPIDGEPREGILDMDANKMSEPRDSEPRDSEPRDSEPRDSEPREGILDMAANKMGEAASVVLDKAQDIGLKALGLEKIDKSDKSIEDDGSNIDKNNEADASSGIISGVSNIVDKTTTALIDNVNEVLDSELVSESVQNAAKETAEITGKLAENFNDAMNEPEVREEVKEAINNMADVGSVVIKASEKPFQEAAIVGVQSGTKALSAATAGIVKVGTDMMAAVPGVGAVVEVGKMLNDGSKAASAIVEAGSEAVSIASDAFVETSENVKEGLKELEEKKKMTEEISNRTTKSIDNFVKPPFNNLPQAAIPQLKEKNVKPPFNNLLQAAGRSKTKRTFFKHNAKSKRVRFAI